jgi:hypothetical protein
MGATEDEAVYVGGPVAKEPKVQFSLTVDKPEQAGLLEHRLMHGFL